jgi:hypothetical protein
MGLVSGTLAMIFRKGSLLHAKAGRVFVAAMLTMASSAVYLAAVKHDNNNVGGGLLTLYLVATAWMTARRADGETSVFDWAALLIPLGTGATSWLHGIQMLRLGGQEGPLYISMSFFMGTMMFLAAAGDLRMMLRGGVFGRQRVVRHLWRMCLGFFIATGSFFLGQGSKIFPGIFRQSDWLWIPAFLPLLLLVFWLIRVRLFNASKGMFLSRAGDVPTMRG